MVVVVGVVAVVQEEDLQATPTAMWLLHPLKILGSSLHWVASEMSALAACCSCSMSLWFLLVWEFVLVIGSGRISTGIKAFPVLKFKTILTVVFFECKF